jgi:hypothetical protein
MPLSSRIRALIDLYRSGQITVDDFRERFMPLFVESDQSDHETEQLAIDVESTYSEFAANVIEESVLRNRLSSFSERPAKIRLLMENPVVVMTYHSFEFLQVLPAHNAPTVPATSDWESSGSLPQVISPNIRTTSQV